MEQHVHHCRAPDGSEIAYATVGAGPPVLFTAWWLSHVELDWSDATFRTFFEMLAQRHLVVRYDRPDAGLSGPRHGDLSLESEVAYARTVIDHLGLRRYALFGTSCGGPTAVALAVERPEAVTNLVLYGTYSHGAKIASPAAQQAMIGLVESAWGVGVRTLTDVFMRGASPAGTAAFLARQRAMATPRNAARLMRLTFQLDVSDIVGAVRAPTLVLHRDADPAIPLRLGQRVARRIPGARFTALTGETHVPWDGEVEAVAREVELFLTRETPATPAARRIVTLLVTRMRGSRQRGRLTADAIVNSALARFGGRVVRGKASSTVAMFDSPAAAVSCARALCAELAGTTAIPRIGLHVGEVSLRAGAADGIHAEIAERVAEAAEPGEIMATGTATDLLVAENIRWRERGNVELAGVPGVWRLRSIDAHGRGAADAQPDHAAEPTFRRDGQIWTLCLAGVTARLPDLKGLADLHTLLTCPGVPVPATHLAGEPEHRGAEPVLDEVALRQFHDRLATLDGELARADAVGDDGRSARAAAERDTILAELRTASGLTGRQRRLGDPTERARKAVTARIRDAITRIDAVHPELGVHLRASIRTGTCCAYQPSRRVPWML